MTNPADAVPFAIVTVRPKVLWWRVIGIVMVATVSSCAHDPSASLPSGVEGSGRDRSSSATAARASGPSASDDGLPTDQPPPPSANEWSADPGPVSEVFELGLLDRPTQRVSPAPDAPNDESDGDGDGRWPTLRAGDRGPDVRALQQALNRVRNAGLAADGVYGPATTTAVEGFQTFVWLPVTGEADHDTRVMLAALDANPRPPSGPDPAWPAPTVGNGSFPGCQVALVGDSLMAGLPGVHRDALAEIGCAADVDGVGGRSLNRGWQCRVPHGNGTMLRLLPDRQVGNDTCAPSGLELLEMWATAGGLGNVVVVALGTNDAGLHRESTWVSHWESAMQITGHRPVVFLTTQARPGDRQIAPQAAYSAALRSWCATTPLCHLADWAATAVANDPASYSDGVHLRSDATRARARFIRDSVAAVLAGAPPAATTPVATITLPPSTTIPSTTTTTTIPTSTTTTATTTATTSTTTTIPTSTTTTIPTSSTTSTTSTSTTDGDAGGAALGDVTNAAPEVTAKSGRATVAVDVPGSPVTLPLAEGV